MLSDARHAVTTLVRMPAISVVVILSLGLGIGVNTVVFSWIQARILDPIPGVADGAQVRLIEPRSETGRYPGSSWPEFVDTREALQSFETLFAARMVPLYVGEPGNVHRRFGLLVSDNYFPALGLQPVVGRFFGAGDIGPDAGPVAVISHRLWQSDFQGSSDVLAQAVRINGQRLTVVGVTPAEFQGTVVGLQFDAWLPATLARSIVNGSREIEDRGFRGYSVMGRLRAGVSEDRAQQELDALMTRLAREHPATNRQVTADVLPLTGSPRGPQRMLNAALAVLQGVMLLLLAAVSGNVATLMLARASARQVEVGIRLALGARPARIASLLLTENLLLGILGAALGALVAAWGAQALLVMPAGLPLRLQAQVEPLTVLFAMTLGIVSGLLIGAVPATYLARIDPQAALRGGTRTARRSHLRHTIVGAQVALAVVVLLVAGLFIRAYLETRTDTGFDRDGVALVAYDLTGREADAATTRDLAARLLATVQELPEVDGAAIASSVPLDIHGLPSRPLDVEGHARSDGASDEAASNIVTPGYFQVMRIPLVAGRDFAPLTDASAPRQVIVNEEFVRQYASSGEPMGRRVRSRGIEYRIVGVAADSLYNAFGEPPTPAIYFSYRDLPQPRGEVHVRLRATGDGVALAGVQRAIGGLDPDLPVFNPRSMNEHVDTNLVLRRIPARMFAVLAPLLLVLAAIGIYATVAYSMSLRKREVGLRIAVGGTRGRVTRQMMRRTLLIAAAGAMIGWGAAATIALRLPPTVPVDAGVFAGVPMILMSVVALACWLPARRAAAVDPAVALRE